MTVVKVTAPTLVELMEEVQKTVDASPSISARFVDNAPGTAYTEDECNANVRTFNPIWDGNEKNWYCRVNIGMVSDKALEDDPRPYITQD
jgi:hypothetical protein